MAIQDILERKEILLKLNDMNTILQKRIEEAAMQVPFERGTRESFRDGATFILSHLWISVEEALPEDNELYFVAYKAMDRVLYSTGYYEADIKEWYVDGYGYMSDVSYWMSRPQLEGGKK